MEQKRRQCKKVGRFSPTLIIKTDHMDKGHFIIFCSVKQLFFYFCSQKYIWKLSSQQRELMQEQDGSFKSSCLLETVHSSQPAGENSIVINCHLILRGSAWIAETAIVGFQDLITCFGQFLKQIQVGVQDFFQIFKILKVSYTWKTRIS